MKKCSGCRRKRLKFTGMLIANAARGPLSIKSGEGPLVCSLISCRVTLAEAYANGNTGCLFCAQDDSLVFVALLTAKERALTRACQDDMKQCSWSLG